MYRTYDWLVDVEGRGIGFIKYSARAGVVHVRQMLRNGGVGHATAFPEKSMIRRGTVMVDIGNTHWLATDNRT